MSKQGSLDAFFGTKPIKKKKKGPKQTKLNGFLHKTNTPSTTNTKPDENDDNHPPPAKRKTPDTADESEATTPVPAKIRKRRVIDDDDEDSSDDEQHNPNTSRTMESPAKIPKQQINDASTVDSPTNASLTKDNQKQESSSVASKPKSSGSKKPTSDADNGTNNDTATAKKEEEPHHETTDSITKDDKKPAAQRSDRQSSILLQAASAKNAFPSDQALLQEMAAAWPETGSSELPLPYSMLCDCLVKIEGTTKRLEIQSILTTLFRQVMLRAPSELITCLYLGSNSVAAAYECVELGIGDAILVKAIAQVTGSSITSIKEKYKNVGDLGSIAETAKSKQKTLGGFFASSVQKKPLTSKEVLGCFREIAHTKGSQSQKFKVDKIQKLLTKATPIETKYIIRGLQGKLRIGLAESTVLISLAHALALTVPATMKDDDDEALNDDAETLPPEAANYMDTDLTVEKRLEAAVSIVKKAYSEVPSYEAILKAALEHPLQVLHRYCTLTPGIPVAPMLAKPTKSVQEVLKRLNGLKFTCEYKYDGERAQIHMLEDGTTKVFSRNLLDTSEKYPEVPLFVKEACQDVTSFVLDAEVVAFNKEKGQLVPFQVLSTRKKTEESAETAKVQVIVQAFDLMYLNGASLLDQKLVDRRALMNKHFSPVDGKFQFAVSLDHEENGDTTVLEEFLDAAVKGQCEGLMVKTLEVDAIYEPSRRSLNWLKLKKDYLEGLGDSVDLVPLGAYHGRGKRTGFYGAYLLACYDPDTEEFQSVCKIGTGFSDEDLKTLAESLNKHKIPTKSSQYNVTDQLECDVWFDAVEVWEVRAADLSKSSAHRGAVGKTGEEGRGIGLRFPRFERKRDDKRPDEATTSDQILEMYWDQDAIQGGDDCGDGGI